MFGESGPTGPTPQEAQPTPNLRKVMRGDLNKLIDRNLQLDRKLLTSMGGNMEDRDDRTLLPFLAGVRTPTEEERAQLGNFINPLITQHLVVTLDGYKLIESSGETDRKVDPNDQSDFESLYYKELHHPSLQRVSEGLFPSEDKYLFRGSDLDIDFDKDGASNRWGSLVRLVHSPSSADVKAILQKNVETAKQQQAEEEAIRASEHQKLENQLDVSRSLDDLLA